MIPIDNNITCSRCKYLDRYYIKGVTRFSKTEYGWCSKKRESIKISQACEQYEQRKNIGKVSRRVKVCLNDLLTEITEIRKMIEAEQNEV